MDLLKVRIAFLASAFIHLAVTAGVTLSIDITGDEDPKIREYYYVRWKLLTCWFNVVTLVYLLLRLYADIWTLRTLGAGYEEGTFKRRLNHVTDVIMTSIFFPTTVFGDVIFWSIYLTKPDILGPVRIFEYLPYWSQHSLHSVSLAVVITDLLLTPRRRPKSLKPRWAILCAFSLLYTAVIYRSLWNGEYVYSFLEYLSSTQLVLGPLFAVALVAVIFHAQWLAIDLVWKRKMEKLQSDFMMMATIGMVSLLDTKTKKE